MFPQVSSDQNKSNQNARQSKRTLASLISLSGDHVEDDSPSPFIKWQYRVSHERRRVAEKKKKKISDQGFSPRLRKSGSSRGRESNDSCCFAGNLLHNVKNASIFSSMELNIGSLMESPHNASGVFYSLSPNSEQLALKSRLHELHLQQLTSDSPRLGRKEQNNQETHKRVESHWGSGRHSPSMVIDTGDELEADQNLKAVNLYAFNQQARISNAQLLSKMQDSLFWLKVIREQLRSEQLKLKRRNSVQSAATILPLLGRSRKIDWKQHHLQRLF